jgi:tight adherence protein B
MSRPPLPRFDRVAATVQRLAVLLAAGIAPASAWRHVAEEAHGTVARAVADIELGSDVAGAIVSAAEAEPVELAAWSTIAAAWTVAGEVGAPLAPTLNRLAEVLRGLAQAGREVELALAGPDATARIVLALPPLGLIVGTALGVNPFGVLLTTPVGLACLAVGIALLVAARRWSRRMVGAARDADPTPGLGLELLAIGLSGGGSPERSLALVQSALARSGLPELTRAAHELLTFATSAGIPASALLRAEADEERRIAHADARRRAELLGTRLLLPLGLCVLPAFVLLGVVPVVIAIVSTTVAVW